MLEKLPDTIDVSYARGAIPRTLATRHPGSLAAVYATCYAQFRDQDLAAARHETEALHTRYPQDLEVAFLLADICRAQEDTAGEITCLNNMVPHYPDVARLYQRLAYVLAQIGHPEKAVVYASRARQLGLTKGSDAEVLAAILFRLNRYAEAIPVLEEALAAEPERYEAIVPLSLARAHVGDADGAVAGIDKALDLRPFSIRGAEVGEAVGLTTLVIERSDLAFFNRPDFINYHYTNFPTYLTAPDLRMVHAPLARRTSERLEEADLRPDIVLNNVVINEMIDERMRDLYLALAAPYVKAGVPIVNCIESVDECGREANSQKFEGEAGFTFPRTWRITPATMPFDRILAEIEADYEWPIILRPTWSQLGSGMRLIDGADALREAIDEMSLPEYYVIQYHECRDEHGVGHQFRAVVIGDELSVDRSNAHLGFHSHENLRRVPEWQERGFDRDEQAFLADPDGFLGFAMKEVFAPILARTPLDIYGIDFAVTRTGQPIVFEVNAAMNLFASENVEWSPYLADHFRYLNDTVVQYLRKRADSAA